MVDPRTQVLLGRLQRVGWYLTVEHNQYMTTWTFAHSPDGSTMYYGSNHSAAMRKQHPGLRKPIGPDNSLDWVVGDMAQSCNLGHS